MENFSEKTTTLRKPKWLKKELPSGTAFGKTRTQLDRINIATVCNSAKCPNIWECFSKKTAAFMILGEKCTRNCGFCGVVSAEPDTVDKNEPEKVAMAAKKLELTHVVVTSVTRDDLPDKGAGHFKKTVKKIKSLLKNSTVEILIPDFMGKEEALDIVISSRPNVIAHNIETCKRLYPKARKRASYTHSMDLLKKIKSKDSSIVVKSGFMLGLGEKSQEIYETIKNIYNSGCDILTMGQYLQPSKKNLPVIRYIPPKEFKFWENIALDTGFLSVVSGPFVRSSYNAEEIYNKIIKQQD